MMTTSPKQLLPEQNFPMLAKTFKGLEPILAKELIDLGADNVKIERRAVSFSGNKELLYKANLHLRTASRVLKPITHFKATDPEQIYKEMKKVDWESIMTLKNTFAIDATVFSDEIRHSQYATYRAKDAIADWFFERYNKRPSVDVVNPDLRINLHIAQNYCTLSLDSSGESLHKRGWRVSQNDAPINEALAAGMLLMAGWDGQCDFVDPMCGSGTLLIEAAMIALNIPPGIYRSSFGFEQWNDFDEELFDRLYNDDSHERNFSHTLYGSDQSAYAIRIAERNVKSAGLNKYIKLKVTPIQSLTPPTQNCIIVTNPPYGERIVADDMYGLYEDIGRCLKHQFAGSTAWVISSQDAFLEKMGLKPSKKIKLLNGKLDCSFCRYDLFKGKRNDFLAKKNNSNIQQ